jgi:hypothetical protein
MFNLQEIIHQIEEEAELRFSNDPSFPGGKIAKLHAVLMEIGLEVGKIMNAIQNECK